MATGKRGHAQRKERRAPAEAVLRGLLGVMRREAGYTQRALAKRLGKPQSYVGKYETGKRRLDMIELNEVCRTLKTSLPEFTERLESALAGSR